HGEAKLLCPLDLSLERGARTACEGAAVRGVNVAKQPGYPPTLVVVRQNAERRQVRLEEHIGLLDPHESLDGRPVEHDFAGERLVELAARHLDVLVHPEDVGELEPEEVDVKLLGQFYDVPFAGPAQVRRKSLPRWAGRDKRHATSVRGGLGMNLRTAATLRER